MDTEGGSYPFPGRTIEGEHDAVVAGPAGHPIFGEHHHEASVSELRFEAGAGRL
jgi:hypothetical protein